MKFNRIILMVLDSVGIGEMPDAASFGDAGADTLGHIDQIRGLSVPNMEKLGLGKLRPFQTIAEKQVPGAYATTMRECSPGKDTITGHWEFMGIINHQTFPEYPDGFPEEVMDAFTEKTGYGYLGNKPASGTVIIQELGDEHVRTGKPIVYTSGDSVFQIAAHEDVVPLEELYRICDITRNEIMTGQHAVARIIARPFVKSKTGYVRTENRRDFALEPPYPTALDLLTKAKIKVGAIGKIEDMFVKRGITHSIHSHNNVESCRDTLKMMKGEMDSGFIFANLVDFDMLYGHRRNVQGYGDALEAFDQELGKYMNKYLLEDDLLILTADHGCDPSFRGTDHTRERVLLLMYSPGLKGNSILKERSCFTDIAATVLDNFDISHTLPGKSFLNELS
ncbi:MAG: phosphopentomutase [Acidobacteria bacterium CG_4_9_14_3_um_filter_49_7]|nr:MAG: phosphopentomutase [Acidobacteria bacterium CG_4_9_14_3_um_filter_49_7]